MVQHAYNSSTQKAEARVSPVQGQPGQHQKMLPQKYKQRISPGAAVWRHIESCPVQLSWLDSTDFCAGPILILVCVCGNGVSWNFSVHSTVPHVLERQEWGPRKHAAMGVLGVSRQPSRSGFHLRDKR